MVTAAKVEPFERTEMTAKVPFQHLEGFDQRVGILFAERVHMKALYAGGQLGREVLARDAETGKRRAGVVNRARLRGMAGIDAQPRAHTGKARKKSLKLPDGIENDMTANPAKLVDFIRFIGRGVNVVFLSHLF